MRRIVLSLILLVVAIILFTVFLPFGVIFALTRKWDTHYFSKILLRIAVSIDQLSNVTCAGLYNHILVKSGKPFGLEDDTVSEVLGNNRDNLTQFGQMVVSLLEYIDPGHLNTSLVENKPY